MSRPAIDYNAISAMYPDECVSLFLTQREIAFLMAITPLLGWSATWRLTPGRDLPTTLPDGILPIDVQSEIEGKLMTTCTLSTELDRIAQAIDNIPNCCTSGGGGGAGTSTGTQDVDPPPVDNDTGQPEGWPDNVDYETYNCAASNALIDSISSIFERAMLNDLFNAEDAVQSGIPALVSILGLIIGVALTGLAGLVVGIVGVIAGLAVKLVTGGWSSQTIVDSLADNYDDLTCCLAAAQTKDGVITCFNTALGANSDDARIVGYLLKFGNMANWLFEYHPEIPASDCQCTQPTGDCTSIEESTGDTIYWPCRTTGDGVGTPSCNGSPTPQYEFTRGNADSVLFASAVDTDGCIIEITDVKGLSSATGHWVKINSEYNVTSLAGQDIKFDFRRFWPANVPASDYGTKFEFWANGVKITGGGTSDDGTEDVDWHTADNTVHIPDNGILPATFYFAHASSCTSGNHGYAGLRTVCIKAH